MVNCCYKKKPVVREACCVSASWKITTVIAFRDGDDVEERGAQRSRGRSERMKKEVRLEVVDQSDLREGRGGPKESVRGRDSEPSKLTTVKGDHRCPRGRIHVEFMGEVDERRRCRDE